MSSSHQAASAMAEVAVPGGGDEALGPTSAANVAGTFKNQRSGSLSRAGSAVLRASSTISLQRANSLPTEPNELEHAATMPILFDQETLRPCCCNLWKVQQLFGFLLGIGLALLLLGVRPVTEYPSANPMLAVTALCACFWIFEVVPVYITALLPLLLLPLLEVTSSDIVAKAYWNWVSLLVVDICIVSAALGKVGVARRLTLKVLLMVGVRRPVVLLACFMTLSWLLSAFVNSIAIALLITPFAVGLMQVAEEQVRNEHADAVDVETATQGSSDGVDRQLGAVQRLADCLLLGIAYSASAGGLATLTGSVPHYFLAGAPLSSQRVSWSSWLVFGTPAAVATGLLAFGALWFRYIRTMKISGLDAKTLENEHEAMLSEIGPCSRDEVAVALVQVLQILLMVLRPFVISPVVTTEFGDQLVNDATVATIPVVLLFLIPSALRPGQALLTWPDFQHKFDFGLLLLIGGAMAISSGFVQSGLNIALGAAIADAIPAISPFALDLLIIVCVSLCSQVFSSIGTAASMLPVLEAAAQMAIVNPMSLVLPAMVGTSFAFLLPTATPSNVVVLALSQDLMRPLRVRDFFLNGVPLTILACVVGAALTHVMGAVVFDSYSPFPLWACDASQATCMFVDVPGWVQGRFVDAQACLVNMDAQSDGSTCRLWNGTTLSTMDFTPVM